MKHYSAADASIIGTTHRRMKYNNQDASYFICDDNIIVGIVCDGCGSAAHSEVGAQLGARFIAAKCIELFRDSPFDVERLAKQIETYLKGLASICSVGKTREFILDYLLFTLIGFVVKQDLTHIFWAGDGVVMVNDELTIIDRNNRPEYFAKTLLGEEIEIEHHIYDTHTINHLMIGTDGVEAIITNQGVSIGNKVSVLEISDLFLKEHFFSKPAALPKYLSDLEATESILLDDTTVILLKKEE
jgi:hypothetical protein